MPLVTLEEADLHLRLGLSKTDSPEEYDDPRVPDVQAKIDQATGIILNYLKVDPEIDPDDSPALWGDRDRECVRAAVLIALSALYDDENERTIGDYMKPDGTIPLLLMRLRDPALA